MRERCKEIEILLPTGSSLIPLIVFLVGNTFFAFLDLTGKPAALLKYRIQEEKTVPVSWKKYKKSLKWIALNIFVVGPAFNVVVYPLTVWRGNECGLELPSFLTTVWHFFCYIVVEEIGFYYWHRYVDMIHLIYCTHALLTACSLYISPWEKKHALISEVHR